MAEKSIRKNYAYNASYSILTVLTPLITAPYISRVLQADGVGISSYAGSVAAYFGIFANLGTWTFARREISYCRDDAALCGGLQDGVHDIFNNSC